MIEMEIETGVGGEVELHQTAVIPLEDQVVVSDVGVPLGGQDGEDPSSRESERDACGYSSSNVDGLTIGVSDLKKDVSNLEIYSLHSHPLFLNFKKMPEPVLQCFFWPDKWKVLCTCIFLNCTRRSQVEKVVWKFFETYPTPQALLAASDSEVQEIVKPLGFYKRRTIALKRMSEDFLSGSWKNPEDLRSVGVYAATCYRMMFQYEVGTSPPDDHALKDLWVWMRKELRPALGRSLPDVLR